VKKHADELRLPTFTPDKLKDPEIEAKVRSLKPDFFVVSSYGKLVPTPWLSIPRVASWNIHPSLLPKYRGAAPITWQIVDGEKETGVTIAFVTKDLDAGDIIHQIRMPLGERETTESLTRLLGELSRKVLEEAFQKLERGELKPSPQDHSISTYARKLTKEDGQLNLAEEAVVLERKIRAFHPWPGTFLGYEQEPLRVVEAVVDSIACAEAEPATLLEVGREGHLRLQTGKGSLKIFKVQLPGRKVVTGAEFANGQRLKPGFVFKNLP
jgi:methionyl-tRNA formyltransferase